jgi:hypothetical protein
VLRVPEHLAQFIWFDRSKVQHQACESIQRLKRQELGAIMRSHYRITGASISHSRPRDEYRQLFAVDQQLVVHLPACQPGTDHGGTCLNATRSGDRGYSGGGRHSHRCSRQGQRQYGDEGAMLARRDVDCIAQLDIQTRRQDAQ